MTAVGRHNDIGVPFGTPLPNAPPPPHNTPLIWRLAAIIALPIAVWLASQAIYQRTPQSAAGLHYDVVVNRLTHHACIDVKGEPTPASLVDLACD